jgi:hypothetical protein
MEGNHEGEKCENPDEEQPSTPGNAKGNGIVLLNKEVSMGIV